MRLERSFIGIRQRSILEILDLALPVLRVHAWKLFLLAGVGILPFAVANAWLLSWMLYEYSFEYYRAAYAWMMMFLVINQAPAATIMVSHYLGQVMFIERPSVRDTIVTVTRRCMPLIWLHGVIGLIGPVLVLAGLLALSDVAGLAYVFLVLAVMAGALVRSLRPFVSEVITLEQSQWRRDKLANQMGFAERSRMLHGAASADNFGNTVVKAWFAGFLALSLYAAAFWISQHLGLGLESPGWAAAVLWPLALWTTAVFFGVVRFLSYINARINQEGWDVEIRVRAEGQKLLLQMLLVIGLLLAGSGVVQAATPDDREFLNRVELPWYDAANDSIRSVPLEPGGEAVSRDRHKVAVAPQWKPPVTTGGAPMAANFWALDALVYGLIALLVVAILAAIIWYFMTRPPAEEDDLEAELGTSIDVSRIAELPFAVAGEPGDFRSLASRSAQAGDYALATVYLFSHLLLLLDKHHWVRLRKGRTNRQYMWDLSFRSPLRSYFERAMVPFEQAFFGAKPILATTFEGLWQQLPEMENLIRNRDQGGEHGG